MPRMIATETPTIVPFSDEPAMICETIKRNVDRIRLDQNVSQRELAKRLSEIRGQNTSQSHISQQLSGKHDPGWTWIEAFARALGVSPSDLLI